MSMHCEDIVLFIIVFLSDGSMYLQFAHLQWMGYSVWSLQWELLMAKIFDFMRGKLIPEMQPLMARTNILF